MDPYRSAPRVRSEKIVIEQVGEPEIEQSGDRLIIKRTYQLRARVELVEVESEPEPMFKHFQKPPWTLVDLVFHPVVVLCAAILTTAYYLA